MTRLLLLAPLMLVTACAEGAIVLPGQEPAAPEPRVLPAEVQAAMLPGVPDSIVVQSGTGCYIVSNEITDPREGYLLRDAAGQALCYDDGGNRIAEPSAVPAAAAPGEAAAEITADT